MVSRLLYLEEGQLRRAWPFFALYLVLFAALTLADGLSLALFVTHLGADRLPWFQAVSAVCVMLSVGWYLHTADRSGGDRVFVAILVAPLVLFAAIWVGLNCRLLDDRCLGLLFLGRELAFALVLLHFGAYLQEYFTRAELNRVMPVIYAGGRLGGIAGGATLEHASAWIAPIHLLLLLVALLLVSIVGVRLIPRFAKIVPETLDAEAPGAGANPVDQTVPRPARETLDAANVDLGSWRGFAGYVWRSPLLFWITASTAALFCCRAGLVLQYNVCFERQFTDDATLARFLGRYAQVALAVSLPFQLFVVSRLVARVGLRGAQLTYAVLIAAAACGGWGGMSLAGAVFARFVETELRYGLRNPLAQMTVNLFPRRIRTQTRAWSLGLLIPATTIVAALGLDLMLRSGAAHLLALVTTLAAAGYLVASLGLASSIAEGPGHRAAALRRMILARWNQLLRRGSVVRRRSPAGAFRRPANSSSPVSG